MLTQEQVKEIKNQLLKQLDKLPEEEREELEEQIEEMDAKELEEFLMKNKMIKTEGETKNPFREIVEGKIKSYKVSQNKKAIAILEINPISTAHSLVIPKQPAPEILPKEAITLANTLSKKIKKKFGAKKVELIPSKILGEFIINVLPVYNGENLESKRKKASDEELIEIQKTLTKREKREKRVRKEKTSKPKKSEERTTLPKAPVRIP